MKKKSPPWALLGAVALGIFCIVIFLRWNSGRDAAYQDQLAKMKADYDQKFQDLQNQKPVAPPPDTANRPVYYATQPVEAGTKISPAFFEKKATPNEILPDAYTDQTDVVGFYAIRKIEKGDPLTPRNIGKSLPFLSQRITPGMRAISLPVFNAEYNATGGFVVDGDKVDLLFTPAFTQGGETVQVNTQTIMQNLPVLYVPGPTIKTDQTDGIVPAPPPGEAISVTFEVTPEQAEALVHLARSKGASFSMILRSRRDTSEVKIKPFDIRDYDMLNLKKVQTTIDKSIARVNELHAAIEAKEKALQGTTNETPTPTPPSP